jgi:hypothetical protein
MIETVVFGQVLDPWLVFVTKAFVDAGFSCRLLIVRRKSHEWDGDERDCFKWLEQNPGFPVEEIGPDQLSSLSGSVLFVSMRGSHAKSSAIPLLANRFSRSVLLLRFAGSSKRWQAKQLLKEIVHPFYRYFSEIWTEDSDCQLMCLVLQKKHRYFGVLPHQRCSVLQEHWLSLQKPIPQGKRELLFSWAGTLNPNREAIVNWIEARLDPQQREFSLGHQSYWIVWHNDLPGGTRPRDYESYLKEIESAWFSLCLPGYTGTTNRMLESILRGAIPVLPAEQVKYTRLPLLDQINEIFVYKGDWIEALHRIALYSQEKCLSMQQRVVELAQGAASLGLITKRLLGEIF